MFQELTSSLKGYLQAKLCLVYRKCHLSLSKRGLLCLSDIADGTSPRALFFLRKEACTAISTAYGYPRRFNFQYLHWTVITNRHLVGKKLMPLSSPFTRKFTHICKYSLKTAPSKDIVPDLCKTIKIGNENTKSSPWT